MCQLNHYEAIRVLSGVFQPDVNFMADRLFMVNLIARNALGLATDRFTYEKLSEYKIQLIREPDVNP